VRYKDSSLWAFLDLFGHRMVSLFYRAWERYRFTVAYERGDRDKISKATEHASMPRGSNVIISLAYH